MKIKHQPLRHDQYTAKTATITPPIILISKMHHKFHIKHNNKIDNSSIHSTIVPLYILHIGLVIKDNRVQP